MGSRLCDDCPLPVFPAARDEASWGQSPFANPNPNQNEQSMYYLMIGLVLLLYLIPSARSQSARSQIRFGLGACQGGDRGRGRQERLARCRVTSVRLA
jgi:hypothetical protein